MDKKSLVGKVAKKLAGGKKSKPAVAASRLITDAGIRYRSHEKALTLVDGTAASGEVIIPGVVQGMPVTAIGKGAFSGNRNLKRIALPEQVSALEKSAFEGCSSLEFAELPVWLEIIGTHAFAGCGNLAEVVLPARLRHIYSSAFEGCSSLKSLPHKVVGGISSKAFVTEDTETHLPTSLKLIGERAFYGCSSLEEVVVPCFVKEIRKEAFGGCSSLCKVTFHMDMRTIREGAFAGCSSLKSVRLPERIEEIESGAFDSACAIVAEEGSAGAAYAHDAGNKLEVVAEHVQLSDSAMVPIVDESEAIERFYTDEQLEAAESVYQLRAPVEYFDRPVQKCRVVPSRYSYDGASYVLKSEGESCGRAEIVMVGDLMCRFAQQAYCKHEDGFHFDAEFDSVRDIIKSSDLAIGNMESLVSNSSPYMSESRYVEDRPHLNSPDAYLSAVRAAGFDVVVNAQNHIYDAGVRGLFETFDALNRYQLMHIGAYASENDRHFLLVDVNGIKVGIVGFMDQARQKMKRVNFTQRGLESLFSPFEKERVEQDIAQAKEAGAEFVIAYCHWGREYTTEITKRQETFAKMVADGGADYIFGSHSHCPQPRTVVAASDGRLVPCVYSGGNFISDISIELPVTRDTFINKLVLGRDEAGKVYVATESYIPCRIVLADRRSGSVTVLPCESMISSHNDELRYEGEEAAFRIASSLGNTAKSECESPFAKAGFGESECAEASCIALPARAELGPENEQHVSCYERHDANHFSLRTDSTVNEVRISCLGLIAYDAALERNATFGLEYVFRPSWEYTRSCVGGDDLVIGALGCSCSADVPTSGLLPSGELANCRPEYLDAIQYAGVDCLAAASFHSFDGDARSAENTRRAIEANGMAQAGLGSDAVALFDANGIRVAVLSYAQDCRGIRNVLTQAAGEGQVRVYDSEVFHADVAYAREEGAEFILAYLDCTNEKGGIKLAARKAIAHEMAETGADCVVCVRPAVVSEYERFQTADGREVPIYTSLGTYMAGYVSEEHFTTAVARLSVRKDETGAVFVKDCYVPMKRFAVYRGASNVTAAATKYYNDDYALADFKRVKTTLAKELGEGSLPDPSRRVKMKTHCRGQLSIKQICEMAGVELSAADRKKLGVAYEKPVKRIVNRRQDLSEGCVAVIFKTKPERRFTAEEASKAGALMVIGREERRGGTVPYLSVSNPYDLFKKLMVWIRGQYQPFTVAITGTMGKSTTKELAYGAFAQHFKTLCVEGNNNTINTAPLVMQKLSDEDEAYIQEVHEGTAGSACAISELIKPSVCIITAVAEGHLEQLGTMDNVVKEIMSVTAGMDEDGLLVLNDDNEYLHEQKPDCRTVRVSAHNEACDYYAKDIVESGGQLRFTICCAEGEYRALLNMPGIHNVTNALGVFAAGREAGIPPYEIISGMGRYNPSTSGHQMNRQRQNLLEYRGYRMLVDCYNSAPEALKSAVATVCGLEIAPGSKRVAVLADMAEQGNDEAQVHFDAGAAIGASDIDVFLCYGKLSRHLVEGVRSVGGKAFFFAHRETFNRAVAQTVRPGDAVLFKASHGLELYDKTVVPVFGDVVR